MPDARFLPAKTPGLPTSPFELSSGVRLSLPELCRIFKDHLTTTDDNEDRIYVSFVYATGRDLNCMGQIGLVCDALFTPEIAVSLTELCKGKRVRIQTALDLDMVETIEEHGKDRGWSERPHMILCGTGDINAITADVIAYYQEVDTPIRPGMSGPYSADILGLRHQSRYSAQFLPNGACLVAVRNPWWPDRAIIICGGIFGVGTVGALWMLHEYLRGNGHEWGNNRFDDSVPGKVIDANPKAYERLSLRDVRDLVPQHDIRNIDQSDSPISVVE